MKWKGTAVAAFGLFAFTLPLAAEAKVDPRIFEGKGPEESASFLVVMRGQADLSGASSIRDKTEKRRFVYEALRDEADQAQAAIRSGLEAAGVPYRSFYLFNMIEVQGSRSLAQELANREDVAYLAANRPARLKPRPRLLPEEAAEAAMNASPRTQTAVEPNVALIRAPEVWARGFTGQGIVIGMADTGFKWDHPALEPHYRGFNGASVSHDYNWHDAVHNAQVTNPCGSNAPAPCDDDSHGTATASLAVGDDGAGNQVGVAPGAKIIGCRNMDEGNGTPARYTECFQFFLTPTDHNGANPRPDLAADVISNSWGCPASEGCTTPDILKGIVEIVRAAGILVVVAAGNEGSACETIDIPGLYEACLTVGATTNSDVPAGFSSRGPVTADGSNRLKPDVCAPGVGLRVASLMGGFELGFSGTSGSTPEVAGAAALIWSVDRSLIGKPSETEDLLRQTAVPVTTAQDCPPYPGSAVPNAVAGYGRIDVAAAVEVVAPLLRSAPNAVKHARKAVVVAPR